MFGKEKDKWGKKRYLLVALKVFLPLGRQMCPPIAGEVNLRVCILGEGVRCVGLDGDHHYQQDLRSKI